MAGEFRPYWLVDRITFGAAGTGTLELPVGATEEFRGKRIFFVASAGSFSITKIEDRGGIPFTNADSSNPIPSALFLTALDERTFVAEFGAELNIAANNALKIEVTGGTDTATLDCIVQGMVRTL